MSFKILTFTGSLLAGLSFMTPSALAADPGPARFDSAARGVVACIEANDGALQQTEFDETGECLGGPNIWIEPSTESSIVADVITSRTQSDEEAGIVQGQVRFQLHGAKACGFSLKVNWSNEDILVYVTSDVNCQPLAALPAEIQATILTADCGEIDPWYVADSCLVDVQTSTGQILRLATWSVAAETYELFLSLYPYETHQDLVGQSVVVKLSDLDPAVEPGAVSVLRAHNNNLDPEAQILWWNGNWQLADGEQTVPEFDDLLCVDLSNPEHAHLKGKDELELFEFYPELSERDLVTRLQSGERAQNYALSQMEQLALARRAIIHCDSVYGAALGRGEYLDTASTWQLLEMTDTDTEQAIDVVYWNEGDDGNYSVMFAEGSSQILYVYYEN